MGKETCELCEYEVEVGFIEKHHVVPREVIKQAGLPESQTLRLCSNCHREVHAWYSAKVVGMAYDPETKRFRTKSWLELVEEYDSIFNNFMKSKKKRAKQNPF